MEKAVALHSSTLAWKMPCTEEPGGLQFMGSLRVGHDSSTSVSLFTFMHWRRKCQPTPVFLPGESQGRGSLVGCRLWGCTELDMTEVTQQHQQTKYNFIKTYYVFDVLLNTDCLFWAQDTFLFLLMITRHDCYNLCFIVFQSLSLGFKVKFMLGVFFHIPRCGNNLYFCQ